MRLAAGWREKLGVCPAGERNMSQAIIKKGDERELFKAVAMDIGKEVVAYVERMYPEAVKAASSTFRLSLRNCIYNEIMAAADAKGGLHEAVDRLAARAKSRAYLKFLSKVSRGNPQG